MKESKTKKESKAPLIKTIFTAASGVGFFAVVMLLTLAGPAGSRTEYAAQNSNTFMFALLITIVVSMAAIRVTIRGREEGLEMKTPLVSWLISVTCTLLLIAKLIGKLSI
jgi:hypothetical protein